MNNRLGKDPSEMRGFFMFCNKNLLNLLQKTKVFINYENINHRVTIK